MITSVVVLLIGAFLIVVIGYVLKIARDVSRITEVVRDESELIKTDIDDARTEIKKTSIKSFRLLSILNIIMRVFMRNRKKRK